MSNDSIFTRVGQLPVVASVYNLGLQYYTMAKDSNRLIKAALNTTEGSVKYAADRAKPIVELVKPLFDDAACKALTKLQERYPSINKTPNELNAPREVDVCWIRPADFCHLDEVQLAKEVQDAWSSAIRPTVQLYENAKLYGAQKVLSVKNYGVQTVSGVMNSHYGQVVTATFNTTLEGVDHYVEHYLPVGSEDQNENQNETLLDVNDALSTKLKKIALKLKARSLRKVTAIGRTLQSRFASLQTTTQVVWSEFKKELNATEKEIDGASLTRYVASAYARTVSRMQMTYEEVYDRISKIASRSNNTALGKLPEDSKAD